MSQQPGSTHSRLMALGARLIKLLEAVRIPVQPRVDRWLARMDVAQKEREQQGFAADTDYAILQQEPLRARVLLRTISVAFAIALMWSAVSRIDEVARRGQGDSVAPVAGAAESRRRRGVGDPGA